MYMRCKTYVTRRENTFLGGTYIKEEVKERITICPVAAEPSSDSNGPMDKARPIGC